MKYKSRFHSEGQFLHQSNAVDLREKARGIPNLAQNFWRLRQNFELSVLACYTYGS